MSATVPGYFNGTVPERATAVTVNQVFLDQGDTAPYRSLHTYMSGDFTNLNALQLTQIPLYRYLAQVFLDGQLLTYEVDYVISEAGVLSFLGDHLTSIQAGAVVAVYFTYQVV
jgi:hypothetical protein